MSIEINPIVYLLNTNSTINRYLLTVHKECIDHRSVNNHHVQTDIYKRHLLTPNTKI